MLRIWETPKGNSFDPRQRGFGIDVENYDVVKRHLAKNPRSGNYLTEKEESYFRNRKLDEMQSIYDKYVDDNLHFSDKKRAMALALMYHGFGKRLWTDKGDGLHNAFFNGSDYEFENAITSFYQKRHKERANNHKKFWDARRPVISYRELRKRTSDSLVTKPIPLSQPDALRVRQSVESQKDSIDPNVYIKYPDAIRSSDLFLSPDN